LALLKIEAACAKVMDLDKLIDRFAEMKAYEKNKLLRFKISGMD